jgi:tRNA-dependent cyclodipeptide synthase
MSVYAKFFPESEFTTLRSKSGYLGLSLSNRITASDDLLFQLLKWTKNHLGSICVFIGDSVYRHNLEDLEGLDRAAALDRAMSEGRAVALRVRRILDSLELKESPVLFASSFHELPEFGERLARKIGVYESSSHFRDLIAIASDGFFKRFAPSRIHSEVSRGHSRDYQLEELAIFELLAEQGYMVNVYPGAHLPVMKDIVAGKFVGVMPSLEKLTLVELRFRSTS